MWKEEISDKDSGKYMTRIVARNHKEGSNHMTKKVAKIGRRKWQRNEEKSGKELIRKGKRK